MKINDLYIIRHLRNTYGGTISGANNNLYIKINDSKIRVNLADKKQNGHYIFFRRSNDKHYYRAQLQDKDLAHGLFLIWCDDFNNELELYPTNEDWLRFVSDAHKYATGR